MKKVERIFSADAPSERSPGEYEPFLHRVFRGLNAAVPGLAMAAEAFACFRHKVKEFNQGVDTPGNVSDQAELSTEATARVAPVSRRASVFEAEPEADRRPDDAALAQMAEQTAQSIETLNRTVLRLDNAVRQIQIRLDTNR